MVVPTFVSRLIEAVAKLGYKLHAFGLSTLGLQTSSDPIVSADSQAWSFKAREAYILLPGHDHRPPMKKRLENEKRIRKDYGDEVFAVYIRAFLRFSTTARTARPMRSLGARRCSRASLAALSTTRDSYRRRSTTCDGSLDKLARFTFLDPAKHRHQSISRSCWQAPRKSWA